MAGTDSSDVDDTFESRAERNLVVAAGALLFVGLAGVVAFMGGRGTGSAARLLGSPELAGFGILVCALLIAGSAVIIYVSDRFV